MRRASSFVHPKIASHHYHLVKARQLVGERKEKVRPVRRCGRGNDGKQRARNVHRIRAAHAKWTPDMGRIAMIRFRLLARE